MMWPFLIIGILLSVSFYLIRKLMANVSDLQAANANQAAAIDALEVRVAALEASQGVPEADLDPVLEVINANTVRINAIAPTP